MANTYYPEPIDGGDNGIWGPKELKQNRLSKGVNSCQLYDDSGVLKLTVGRIGLDNDSGNGAVIVDTVVTVDFSGITDSTWFSVELTRTGSTPSFAAVELSTDILAYQAPANLSSYYDADKGGYYRTGSARIVGFGWKDSSSALAGILDLYSFDSGAYGYAYLETTFVQKMTYLINDRIERKAICEIGDWNMLGTSQINYAHNIGAEYEKIRRLQAIVRNDSDTDRVLIDGYSGGQPGGGFGSNNSTNINMQRNSAGIFNAAAYSTTSYNRGWITYELEE